MNQYCVNNRPQSNGDYEVHRVGYAYWPSDRTDLGNHATCSSAVATAKRIYPRANGCAFCSSTCHTG